MTDQSKLSTAESLRLLADWYEAHPDMPAPKVWVGGGLGLEDARRIARALGAFDKGGDDMFFELNKSFGSLVLTVQFYRPHICTKRVVQKEVVEWDCPALLDDKDAA